MESTPLFYLCSTHGNVGTNVMFHCKDRKGYATNLDVLEKFTLEQSQESLDHNIKALPLLASEVDKLSIIGVDHQYLDYKQETIDPNGEYIIQKKNNWNGNDIAFVSMGGLTYNLSFARRFTKQEADEYTHLIKMEFDIWPLTHLKSICRRVFQSDNINLKTMVRSPGIKYKKPRKKKPSSGKTKMNCPDCGRIAWQDNPHDFEECNNNNCDSFRG